MALACQQRRRAASHPSIFVPPCPIACRDVLPTLKRGTSCRAMKLNQILQPLICEHSMFPCESLAFVKFCHEGQDPLAVLKSRSLREPCLWRRPGEIWLVS